MAIKGTQYETPRQLAAFNHFCRLGRNKTPENFRLISLASGVHVDTVRRWYKKFKWETRPEETALGPVGPTSTEDFLALISTLYAQLKKKIDKGQIKVTSTKDLEIIVKMQALLQGKAVPDTAIINVITGVERPYTKTEEV